MDNRRFDIRSEGKGDFDLSIRIAMGRYSKVIGYRIVDEGRLVLYWVKSENTIMLPYAMNVEEVIAFAWGWLEKEPVKGNEPDHDGENSKGFRVFNEAWGHVFNEYQAFVAIEPIWAMYGK